jgi:acetyltransferase-like isoleucine patch superfamily enzyme
MKSVRDRLLRAFDGLASVLSYGVNPRLINYARLFFNKTYSYAMRRSFKHAGDNFLIYFPAVIMGAENIAIGANFVSYSRLRLETYSEHLGNHYRPRIFIGDNVAMNYDCHIGCINQIVIGNNVLMGSKVHITDHSHGEISRGALATPPALRTLVSKGPVIIEDNVWIGEGVVILAGVRIGENAIIGANAVVTKDIPRNCVAGGIPARVIRSLDEES